jgi:FMN phosphatase YigB (HAD superfamily)
MITTIIFDWGRTLHDNERDSLFLETVYILDYLSSKYQLAIVSLAPEEAVQKRKQFIKEHHLEKYFVSIMFGQDKDALYKKTLEQFNMKPGEVVIVDDRAIRGIKWGNKQSSQTVWLEKGKFSGEKPNKETGMPTHTIHELSELKYIL